MSKLHVVRDRTGDGAHVVDDGGRQIEHYPSEPEASAFVHGFTLGERVKHRHRDVAIERAVRAVKDIP